MNAEMNVGVVLSSRVRLSRNLKGIPFPARAEEQQLLAIMRQVELAVTGWQPELRTFELSRISPLLLRSYVERRIITPTVSESSCGHLLMNDDQDLTLQLGGKDHILIQSTRPGFALDQAFTIANAVDDGLEQQLEYAYDEQWGYLTADPTMVGTGMEASCMLHLPALSIGKAVPLLQTALEKIGLSLIGVYGSGKEAPGYLYRMANQITLGASEEDILRRVSAAVENIVKSELEARRQVRQLHPVEMEDRVWRAWGVITCARRLSHPEFMKFWGDAMLGAASDLLPEGSGAKLLQVLEQGQAAALSLLAEKDLDGEEQNVYRARRVRELLSGG